MTRKQRFGNLQTTVLIIGNGITANSTAYHLDKIGFRSFRLLADRNYPAGSWNCPGLLSEGLELNYTRVSHGHGPDTAKRLWELNTAGFRLLKKFCKQSNIRWLSKRRVRLCLTQPEDREIRIAVDQLAKAGFWVRYLKDNELHHSLPFLKEKIISVQDEGVSAGFIDLSELFSAFSILHKDRLIEANAIEIHTDSRGISITLEDGSFIRAEIVVLGSHLETTKFVKQLENNLVPVVDQWSLINEPTIERGPLSNCHHGPAMNPQPTICSNDPCLAFSANYGYIWGGTTGRKLSIVGGGRYLKANAGIGSVNLNKDQGIAKQVGHVAANLFHLSKQDREMLKRQQQKITATVDIYPSDELPIIGPLFGEPRILISTGYMGNGITMGFIAGKCIAELIVNGSCQKLPRILWPERLRRL